MTRGMYLTLILLAMAAVLAGCAGNGGAGSPAPAVPPDGTDLTNQNAPQAAMFTAYPSQTNLSGPAIPVGLRFIARRFYGPHAGRLPA